MKVVLISIILLLVIINVICHVIGKRKMKGMKEENEDYKVGMKYMYFSVILSMITLITITVIVILNAFGG